MEKLSILLEKYNEGYNEGYFPAIKCKNCGYTTQVLRNRCIRCNSDNLEIIKISYGKIYSYTIINRGLDEVTAVVIVDADGVKVKGNYIGDQNYLKIGNLVKSTKIENRSVFIPLLQ
jgi:uncharacterized OB-fold protein